MWFDGSLASLSIWITYCLQVVFAYLATLCICAFIQNARTRVRVWGGFLLLTIVSWLFLWVPARAVGLAHFAVHSVPLPPKATLHIALPVQDLWASYFAKLAPTAAYLYVFLLLLSLLHLLVKSAQLKTILRQTEPPPSQLQLRFRRLCLELGVGRCELDLIFELHSPATCYWWRSHVLLPMELVPYLNNDQLDDVLRHELVHVRQHDYLWDRLAALGCRLVFFHPLVWLGYRHLRWERELACDYAVVREHTEARLRYAECLTRLGRRFMLRRKLFPGMSLLSSESLLAVRVRALLSEPSIGSARHEVARAGFVSIFASVALLLVPGLGLSLYSPIHLTSVLARPRNSHSDSARKKGVGRATHSSISKAPDGEAPWMASGAATPQSIKLLLDVRPAALPLLDPSAVSKDMTESSTPVNGDVGLQSSRVVWDEAPMPLARPPKWSTLVIGAITKGVGMATGGVDVDDADGPRKRSH